METLKIGARSPLVKELQRLLKVTPDGIFGPKTEAAVKEYQKKNDLSVDGIVGPKTWSRLGFDTIDEVTPNGRKINRLIVHCAATPEGKEFTSAQISDFHKARKFSYYIDPKTNKKMYVGYHYLVHLDGSVEACRPENVRGCHTSGQNANSIGICYIGGVAKDGKTPKDTRTPAQRAALRELVQRLREKYPAATVHGHNEFANKACPSFKICDL